MFSVAILNTFRNRFDTDKVSGSLPVKEDTIKKQKNVVEERTTVVLWLISNKGNSSTRWAILLDNMKQDISCQAKFEMDVFHPTAFWRPEILYALGDKQISGKEPSFIFSSEYRNYFLKIAHRMIYIEKFSVS
ncbi:MAG: hypothetical protein JRE14_10125 [Deltaproteobacteria bacterium]|nr:hypothetical protein [Deltaproteobacteria bacterium]MBW2634456.1 hypothetical protein [Deltaproteobacteria bacterium]